eukprot:1537001-Amphidinium_carterae.1
MACYILVELHVLLLLLLLHSACPCVGQIYGTVDLFNTSLASTRNNFCERALLVQSGELSFRDLLRGMELHIFGYYTDRIATRANVDVGLDGSSITASGYDLDILNL